MVGFLTLISCVVVLVGLFYFVRLMKSVHEKEDADYQAKVERKQRLSPPVWPPRRPDDWGREIQLEYQRRLIKNNSIMEKIRPPPPIMPLIPSWEENHRREQNKDPLQIRWAQNDQGEWVKIQWGNASQRPENGGPLRVVQSMLREDNREWVWVWLGPNPSLDWQRGPSRTEQFIAANRDGSPMPCLRPCGSPAHQDAPAPIQPADEHGSSDWQTPDDLAGLGAIRSRASSSINKRRGGF